MSDKPTPQTEADPRAWLDACSRRALSGDSAALTELHHRLTPGLIRHFKRKLTGGNTGFASGSGIDAAREDLADELAQLTWITFWRAMEGGKYDPSKARLSTFLYAVAANIWLRHCRSVGRSHREQSVEGIEAFGENDAPAPMEEAASAAILELLRSLMTSGEPRAGLSDDDRAVLRSIATGRSDRELASELQVAPSTAHARKKHVLQKVREYLGLKGYDGV